MPETNNPPYVSLDLTQQEYEFLLDNCETNIMFGLNYLQTPDVPETAARKMVAIMEQFKGIRTKLQKATK